MEFGKRLSKGAWAFADKGLPAVNGLAIIFLVQRVLPSPEYAGLALIQQFFLIGTIMCTSFALIPLTKFVAEAQDKAPYISMGLILSAGFFVMLTILLWVGKGFILTMLDPKGIGNLGRLYAVLPLMFLTVWYRTYAVSLLQASYEVRKIFWIDAAYYAGMPLIILAAMKLHCYSSALDVIHINILALGFSTLVAIPLTYPHMAISLRPKMYAFWNMWHYGKYSFLGMSMYTIFSQMDFFFVSSIVGLAAVAAFSVAKTFNRVFDMMTGVIQMFLLPFSSKAGANADTSQLVVVAEKTICFASIALLPCFIVMFFFPHAFLHLVYKGKYDDAAPIMRMLSLFALVVPFNAVISSYLQGLGKVRAGFISGVALLLISLPLYYFLTPVWGATGTAAGLLTGYTIVTIGLIVYARSFAPISVRGVLAHTSDIYRFVKGRLD